MSPDFRLVRLLADGRFHSGADLGAAVGVGRGAIWKSVRSLEDWGLDVFAVPGKGYRLAHPLDLLDADRIRASIVNPARALIRELEIHPSLDSTSTRLLEQRRGGLGNGHACLAEHQTKGRGRRGRGWVSPFGSNLYLSVYWRFDRPPAALGGLSLAAGVAVARALNSLGAGQVGLKWPNDLQWGRRKLGGLLIDLAGEAGGPSEIVLGLGLNLNMPESSAGAIDQPWVDLAEVLGGAVDRNRLAGRVLGALLEAFVHYEQAGFSAFRAEWDGLDVIRGRPVLLSGPRETVRGTALGTDENGALLLSVDGSVRSYVSGEVSLRVTS